VNTSLERPEAEPGQGSANGSIESQHPAGHVQWEKEQHSIVRFTMPDLPSKVTEAQAVPWKRPIFWRHLG
jgi:hypothetical protein